MSMKKEELQKVLEDHKKWLSHGDGKKAALSGADLRYADLRCANLRNADLRCADLRYADLSCADLRSADMSGADLRYADLSGAYLRGADLSDVALNGADLSGADLNGADLSGAYLSGANLCNVRANAHTSMYNLQCPEEGAYIAWKKCKNGVLVKLQTPADALRSSATSRKCRASKAIVLEVIGAEYGVSHHDNTFIYEVGKTVEVPDLDRDRWHECSTGIHHFITRAEAESY